MPDLRFFETLEPISFQQAIAIIAGRLVSGSASGTLSSVAALSDPDLAGAVVYCEKPERLEALKGRAFGLCLTTERLAEDAPSGGAVAVLPSPRLGFALIAARLHRSRPLVDRMGVFSKSIAAHESAVVAADAEIGEGARIGPHVYVGPGVKIGAAAVVGAGVTITHSVIGDNVSILPGARIGQAGFGFAQGDAGLVRVPQLGRVMIEDEVEIGANSTIDRGALEDTVIGRAAKIDNLVQIGHNTRIGRNCVLAAQTGISGSCVIGDGVFMGGQVGLADHLTIGDGAQIAAGSGLMRDVPPGEKWGGRPAKPAKDWLKETATLAKLAKKKKEHSHG